MTWEIVVGIIALFSFATAVIGVAMKITKPIAELNGEIKLLRQSIDSLKKSTDRELEFVNKRLDEHEKRLENGGL